jgi:hypothetical protein
MKDGVLLATNDLLIKINADAKNAEKAFDDLRAQTGDLENQLNKVALISGAAFAALTAEIYFSAKAFDEAQAASVELNNALQNQGIFTKQLAQDYKNYAVAVQTATGIDDDAVTKAQAVAQTYLGQRKITQELTFAIADLSATMGGDLNGAAEKIARTIGTGTNAFARQGLKISETATEAQRYAAVLEFVRAKSGGLAAEFDKAHGYTNRLATAFGNLQEGIGERFSPVLAQARLIAANFFQAVADNPLILDLAVALITAGAAVSGLAAAAAVAIPAFLALKAAMIAFGAASNIALAGIPILIGAVVAGLTLLALNWEKSLVYIKTISTGVVTFISELFSGLGKILDGAFSFDINKINAGLEQLKTSYAKAKNDSIQTFEEISAAQKEENEVQNKDKLAAAEKQALIRKRHQELLLSIEREGIALIRLQNENASAELIDLKTKELEILKALDSEKTAAEIEQLQIRFEKLKELQTQAVSEDLERSLTFEQAKNEALAELKAQGIVVENDLRDQQLVQLQAKAETEASIDRKLQEDAITKRIETNNKLLLDRKKYGETQAAINKIIYSDEVQGAKSAAEDLVALTKSKNTQLKEIGKIAAIAQITITTPEAAIKAYNSLVGIPFVGPALAVTAAAATVAYGAERIGEVTRAQDGGLITGGIAGRDSVPALLEPGELVVPKRNFNDVVGAVRNDGGADNAEMIAILQNINDKISAPQTTVIQGDVHTDDSYIDALVKKISDAVEFRNAKIFGVT